MFATTSSDTTLQVAIITTVGLVVVALIGVITAKVTTGARRESQSNADSASKSAAIAKDYAAALEAKNALIESLEARLVFVEDQNAHLLDRLDKLERRTG